MKPLSLRASNLRTFPSIDWAIPEGITAITGSNGAGKSTLLAAIELALFADGSRDLAPALGPFSERLEVTLEFEHDGETYRVRRGYGKGKATLDFERSFSREGSRHQEPLSRETVRETQALLEETLGLNRATFNASAFLAQGNSAAFPDAPAAERKAILGAILDPRESWPRRANRALAERKITESELQIAQGRIDTHAALAADAPGWATTVANLTEERDLAGISYGGAESDYEQATAKLAANEAAAERYRAAATNLETTRAAAARAQHALADARHAGSQAIETRGRINTLTELVARIPALEQEQEAQRAATAEAAEDARRKTAADERAATLTQIAEGLSERYSRLLTEIDTLQERQSALSEAAPETERCDHCKQILGAEAKAETVKSLRRQTIELIDQADNLELELTLATENADAAKNEANTITVQPLPTFPDLTGPLAAARRAQEQTAGLRVTLANHEAEAARADDLLDLANTAENAYAAAAANLDELADTVTATATLEAAVENARRARANRRVDIDEATAALTRAQGSLENAVQAQTALEQLHAETETTQRRLDTLRLAERAFGRDGIPALIAENTVSVIEAETNRVLEQLPTANGTTFRVELRTQKALKTSDALRETLDILVSDRSTTREFTTFSGGERFRVSFALRWALAKLLANRRGAESRLLVIDEPDGLDAGGMDGLADVLRANADTFSSVLLVSHNPLLASAFEQVIEIVSDGDVSRIGAS